MTDIYSCGRIYGKLLYDDCPLNLNDDEVAEDAADVCGHPAFIQGAVDGYQEAVKLDNERRIARKDERG